MIEQVYQSLWQKVWSASKTTINKTGREEHEPGLGINCTHRVTLHKEIVIKSP